MLGESGGRSEFGEGGGRAPEPRASFSLAGDTGETDEGTALATGGRVAQLAGALADEDLMIPLPPLRVGTVFFALFFSQNARIRTSLLTMQPIDAASATRLPAIRPRWGDRPPPIRA